MARSITFVTRARCHLCDDALEHLWPWAQRLRLEVAEIDVDADASLLEQFGTRVPVLLDARGRVLADGRISARQAARAALRARFTTRG
jgi:hypothetical protein